MKNSEGRFVAAFIAAIIFSLTFTCRAQTNLSELGFTQVSPESAPQIGTFWSWQKQGTEPPLPFNAFPLLPLYAMDTNGTYLIDDSTVNYVTLHEDVAAHRALRQAEQQYGLETPIIPELGLYGEEGGGMMLMSEDDPPSPGGGDSYPQPTHYVAPPYGYSTNSLWLEIVDVTNAVSHLTIHAPAAEQTNQFDLFMTTNLMANVAGLNLTNWCWLFRSTSGQTNLTVTNLPCCEAYFRLGRTNDTDDDELSDAFETLVSHTDPNNGDQNTNSIPDGWEWRHFGNLNQTAEGDYDNDGVSNGDEFSDNTDPNTVRSYALFNSLEINSNTATAAMTILGGVPAKIAVMIDNTNLETAIWTTYTTNIFPVNVGSTDGQHSVFVGLKGRAVDSEPTWTGYELTRDTVAPLTVITNPTSGVVFQPLLQLQGYSTEPLISVRFDLTNASGILTNLEGSVVKQFVDTNTLQITTNWFACTDIELAVGTNRLTLRTMDNAGNVSTNTYDYVFTYPTNPPSVSVVWPQNAEKISGTNFTIRGKLSDATASLTAQIIGGGTTNIAQGVVERDSKFWVEDVPLASATNFITLTAVDISTNTTVTNFVVIKSPIELTITPLNSSYLNSPFVTVSGTVNANTNKIWVNGVEVTNISDGTWSVEGVPLNEDGTALIQARAIPPTDNGGNGTGGSEGEASSFDNPGNPDSATSTTAEIQTDKPAEVLEIHYDKVQIWKSVGRTGASKATVSQKLNWNHGAPGNSSATDCHGSMLPTDDFYFLWNTFEWKGNRAGAFKYAANRGHEGDVCGDRSFYTEASSPGPESIPGDYSVARAKRFTSNMYDETVERTSKTTYELHTGGKAVADIKSVFVLSCSAEGVGNFFWPETDGDPWLKQGTNIDSTQISLGALGNLGPDGRRYVLKPNNQTIDVTPRVAGNSYYTFGAPSVTKHTPYIHANGLALEPHKAFDYASFIVGQLLNFDVEWTSDEPPGFDGATNFQWSLEGDCLNHAELACTNCSMDYSFDDEMLADSALTGVWWTSGGFDSPEIYKTTLSEQLLFSNGQSLNLDLKGLFNMYKPNSTLTPSRSSMHVFGSRLVFADTSAQGITFSNSLSIPSGFGFSGASEWVQTIAMTVTHVESNGTSHILVQPGPSPHLDVSEQYPHFVNGVPVDSPETGLEPTTNCVSGNLSGQFRMWMLFKPTDGMRVPLKVVDWSCEGEAVKSSNIWTLSHGTSDASVSETDQYPEWKSIFVVTNWVPPL